MHRAIHQDKIKAHRAIFLPKTKEYRAIHQGKTKVHRAIFLPKIKEDRAIHLPKTKAHNLPVLLYLPKTKLNPLRQLTVSAPQQETTILPEIV
jgi:hypothetical protein